MKTFATAMVFCLSAATGLAQCSVKHVSPRKEAQLSSAVVVATVTAATPVPAAWDFLDGFNYTVTVNSKLHGKARAKTELTVFSENIPDDFEMHVGHKYVLYLQPKWGRYQVDTCGNSHATDEVLTAKQSKPSADNGL
jgi:hypothetical protein